MIFRFLVSTGFNIMCYRRLSMSSDEMILRKVYILLLWGLATAYHPDTRLERDGLYFSQIGIARTDTNLREVVPPAFTDALLSVLRPSSSSKEFERLREDLKSLASEALKGAKSGCGLCSGIFAILLSLDGELASYNQLHSVIVNFPARNHGGVTNAFYALSKDYGSTMGVLGTTKIAAAQGHLLDADDCVDIANAIALFAREAASVDVFDKLVPPHKLDFKLGTRPRDRITDDMFDDDSTDVHYYISLMKDNAQALSSALLFGMADVADMLGLEPGAVDAEDLRESVDRLSTLDDKAIAQELLMTVNSIRHNLQVTKFNEGLELHASAEVCAAGLMIHHSIVGQQSLFAKMMFLLMKEHFYDMGNKFGSLLIALFMAELGIESGLRNIESLLENHPEMIFDPEVDPGNELLMAMIPIKGMKCEVHSQISRVFGAGDASCLDKCIEDSNCNYVMIRDTSCDFYTSCQRSGNASQYKIYAKESFQRTHPCWPPTSQCIVRIHKSLADIHEAVDSMNWLARHYDSRGEYRTALDWAERSAFLGDSEGKFFSGYLQLKAWDDHTVDIDLATIYFYDLIHRSGWDSMRGVIATDENDVNTEDLEQMEIESARAIAVQLGIHDIESMKVDEVRHTALVHFLAGIYGIGLIYYQQYTHLIPQLITILALVPVLAILIARRTYLD
jgi:hypothetical protein